MNIKPPSTRSFGIKRLSPPSSARYQALIDTLISIDAELVAGKHQLQASIDALAAVCQLIGDDALLREVGVSVTLRKLLAGLNDAALGAKPDWLFGGAINEPEREDGTKKPGRRTGTSSQVLRGLLVNAVSGLIEAGMKNASAASYVQGELRKKGIEINAKTLLQWREQKGDSAPKTSDEADRIITQIRAQGDSTLAPSVESQKQIARMLVEVFARYDSR
jgi:hypothetical protein